jgi:anti-sigma factor RsiW
MSGLGFSMDDESHLDNDALIAHFYGLGEDSDHLAGCMACRERLQDMRRHRTAVDSESLSAVVDAQLLAAQRRTIYQRIENSQRPWMQSRLLRWIPAGAAVIALGVGVVTFQSEHTVQPAKQTLSDVDLAKEVSQLSQEVEAHPTAPLKGLFE